MDYPGARRLGTLGRGSFGEADLFMGEGNEELTVVKFLKKSQIDDQMESYVLREIRNHQLLCGHPSIIQFKQVYLTASCLAIAMEFAAGGDLHGLISRTGRFPEDVARYFFQQLISAVAWCHSKGVCHRDLKLDNLLLDKTVPEGALQDVGSLAARRPQIKLCDFGTSKCAEFDSRPDTLVGTPAYTAPELFAGRKGGKMMYSGEAADVWSCGVTLYYMLVGDMPFRDERSKDNRVAPQLIYSARYTIPEGVEVSSSCRDLLSRIFVADPQNRITVAGIQNHPWFRKKTPKEGTAPRRLLASCLCFCQGSGPPIQPLAPAPRDFTQSEGEIRQLVKEARSSSSNSGRGGNGRADQPGSSSMVEQELSWSTPEDAAYYATVSSGELEEGVMHEEVQGTGTVLAGSGGQGGVQAGSGPLQ